MFILYYTAFFGVSPKITDPILIDPLIKQTPIVPFEDYKKQAPEFNLESVNQ